MPGKAPMTAEQQERHARGVCACGCEVETASHPHTHYDLTERRYVTVQEHVLWASAACKARGYRQRRRAGLVVTNEERRRKKMLEEAEELRAEAREAKRRADYHARTAKRLLERAAALQTRATQADLPLE